MRNVLLIVLFFGLLAVQSGLAAQISLHPWVPILLYPAVFYLANASDVGLLRGSLLSFAAGVLYDSFCGAGLGLQTFVLVASFFGVRGVRDRLVLQGPLVQLVLTFLMTLLGGGLLIALRTIFARPQVFALPSMWTGGSQVLASGVATALVAPLVIALTQRCDRVAVSRTSAKA